MTSQQPQQDNDLQQQIEALKAKQNELLADKAAWRQKASQWAAIEASGLTPSDVAGLREFKARTEQTAFEMDVHGLMPDVFNPAHMLKVLPVQPERDEAGQIVVKLEDGEVVPFRQYLDGLKHQDAEDKSYWSMFRGTNARGTGHPPGVTGGRPLDPVQAVKDALAKT